MTHLHSPESRAKAAAIRAARKDDPSYRQTKEDDTSVCWNYADREVEVFTNRRVIFEKCLQRNPNVKRVVKDHKNRVYSLIYDFSAVRDPFTCLKVESLTNEVEEWGDL